MIGPGNSILFLILRRMRAPLIALVLIYAVSMLGLVFIPGVGAEGAPAPPMGFFHALYFVSYTATTIGFGEIPSAFSEAQRLWTIVIVYLAVLGWTYTVLTLLALIQDRGFQDALRAIRFRQKVRGLREPFYLVCGCGDTGKQILTALDRLDCPAVALEIQEGRVHELELMDLRRDALALIADARSPAVLQMAGIDHPQCRGVIAVTNDDQANLAVAMTAHLLNPQVQVLARTATVRVTENLVSIGTEQIVNPFEKFADYLVLAMREPGCYRLIDWLIGVPGARLKPEQTPPRGDWVICGYGRFGRAIESRLRQEKVSVRVVEPRIDESGNRDTTVGAGTERQILEGAGIHLAEGLVIATDDDIANLAIAVTAREVNPDLFVVIRQNSAANQVLFEAFDADLVMQPSEIIARACLAQLTTPLLTRFLQHVKRQRDHWADNVILRLRDRIGEATPLTWDVRVDTAEAEAIVPGLRSQPASVRLDDLLHDPRHRRESLHCEALLLLRAGKETVLPAHETTLLEGDQLLFAGSAGARRLQRMILQDANVLSYVQTGRDVPGGWVWRWLGRGRARGGAPASGSGA
ncbi:MAG: potassium channel family protein [Gammaproteobacteria bacterium]